MARRAASLTARSSLDAEFDDVIEWYRRELSYPAEFPWEGTGWEPVRLGPTWQTNPDGTWLLPEATIGWQVLGWTGTRLQLKRDEPWRYTLEQARFILWWYSLDEDGRFAFTDGVFQRLKGHGKDPLGSTISAAEALGPARFAEWDGDEPVATDVSDAWVQLAAVSLEQTKNTTRLFPGLFTPEAKAEYGVQIGKEQVHGLTGTRFIQAVTSSPSTLEGARATFVLKNETHHWVETNDGHEMAAVIERNATKSADGAARTLAITNAYEPSEDSVAQRDREAFELAEAGGSHTTGILYDSLEAPPEAPLTKEDAPAVVEAIRGDSVWLDPKRIVGSILDTRNPPSRSRRFWYNQIVAAEDAWIVPQDFDLTADAGRVIPDGARIALFFDGSKSDDATGLVGCHIESGHVMTFGMWQKPPGDRGKGWVVNRSAVDHRVEEVFDRYRVAAFFGDPSHVLDDETQDRFWDALFDEWHRRYKGRLDLWAKPGRDGHAVMWDMADPKRSAEFTAAAERCAEDISDQSLTHDGDPRLRRHAHNARRYPNKWGVSLWKGHRESPRKIDLAVCMVGARMARRMLLNNAQGSRSGVVW